MSQKSRFYTSKKSAPKTFIRVPASVVITLTEDEVLQWLYRRQIAVKGYEEKFKQAVEKKKLRIATKEDLDASGVKYTDYDMSVARFWVDTTAVEGQNKIVTRQFMFPDLTTEVSVDAFKELQTLTGYERPHVILSIGKTTIYVAVFEEGTTPKK